MRITLCLLAVLASGSSAMAQSQLPSDSNGIRGGAPKAPGAQRRAAAPAPAAVPGARARADSVAPAGPGAADLPPTEALFDAINRGDIVTARDAITRGADLDGTNLLGLTPLELSVDLARNDISFLLLSLRGASGSASATRGGPADTPPAPLTPAQRRQAIAAARAEAASARADAAPRRQAPQPGPALFAGNGGTPVPSAGFLGFDPHR